MLEVFMHSNLTLNIVKDKHSELTNILSPNNSWFTMIYNVILNEILKISIPTLPLTIKCTLWFFISVFQLFWSKSSHCMFFSWLLIYKPRCMNPLTFREALWSKQVLNPSGELRSPGSTEPLFLNPLLLWSISQSSEASRIIMIHTMTADCSTGAQWQMDTV